MEKNINKKFLSRIFLVLGLIMFTFGILALNSYKSNKTSTPDYTYNNKNYKGNQAQISQTNTPSAQTSYVSMTTAYNAQNTSYTGKTITISNENELIYFSQACNGSKKANFLGYSYILTNNLDFSAGGVFFDTVGWDTPFSGTFDGQGFEINELKLYLTSLNGYDNIEYYSMFAKNAGTITNIGLISPKLVVTEATDAFGGTGGVSYLVGLNQSGHTVSNSFVIDDDNALEEKAGIAANGGCRVSDFCVTNQGALSNNYVVTSKITNVKVTDVIEEAEMALTNTGTITNCYYCDFSISSAKSSYGTFISGTDVLETTLINLNNGWYTKASYGDYGDFVGIDYAVRRGVAYNNTTHTITIDDEYDYCYMYELFNSDDKMASNELTYEITDNINLEIMPVRAYTYNKGIGATIIGKTVSNDTTTPKFINTADSSYPTIYNADIMNSSRVVKSAGVDCYGLFNYVTGTIKNLNIVPKDSSIDLNDINTSGTENVMGIGIVAGYVEKGIIDNVNVYATITNSENKNIGEYYLGGITGILGGTGAILNSTTAGSITLNSMTNTIPQQSSYMGGIAIGGVVGFIEASSGTVNKCLNAINISCGLGTACSYTIGGVIGAGYTTSIKIGETTYDTAKLENTGNITTTGSTYSKLYVAGVFARQYGMISQVDSFTNNGNVTVAANGNETYVCGVSNADILTSSVNNTGLTQSQLKNGAGNYLYYASAFTNGGEITVTGSSTNLQYTNVLNVKASNHVVSTLSSLFNLSYYTKYNNSSTKTNSKLNAQAINMNLFTTFAPVLNVIGGTSTYTTNVTSIYNLRDINYTITSAQTKNFTYTGVALGEYISYDDCRNEGNLTFTLNQAITGNLTVSGLFNEVSAGSKATNLYNAGNINIQYTANFTGNIYANGICYANRNGFSNDEIKLFNPTDNKYDKTLVGSINNAINSGKITVTNPNYANISFSSYQDILSANGTVTTERHYYATADPSAHLIGNIYASGITNYNYSVITNTFNIADVTSANYITNNNKRQEVNASGIVSYNIGKFAIIENSANDGDIKAINLSFYMVFDNGQSNINKTTAQYAFVNASGIVNRNDATENGTTYNNAGTNSKQIIAFTINYGSIYSYNVARNSTSSATESFRTISAGVLGQGLLNVINVLNYGNVYGSEVSGGIVGVMFFNSFNTEVSEGNEVYLANTINYGNVKLIDKGELGFRSNTYYPQTYSSFLALNNSSTYYVDMDVYAKDYFNGSIFGIINFAGNSNAKYVIIRYLISFNEDVSIVSAEAQTPDVTLDLTTFYSAYLDTSTGYKVIDKYMGQNVVYAPLSTGSVIIDYVKYNGVFNSDFTFQQAIKGNSNYLDIEHFKTDVFITDYFEFIGATYVNTILLDKIGWGAIAYNAAAESFATDLKGVAKFITYIKGLQPNTQYQNLITAALNTDTWLSKCDNQTLIDVVDGLLTNNENVESISAMIQYIFSSSATSYSLIDTSTRVTVLEAILESELALSYNDLLDEIITYTSGYSSILANAVLNSNDEAGEYLHSYISNLSNDKVESILKTYCTYLKDAASNDYFTYSNSEQKRYDILSAMFENINDNSFFENLADLMEIKSEVQSYNLNETLAMYEGYSSLSDENRLNLYKQIILNNTSSSNPTRIYDYLSNSQIASEIDFYSLMQENGYSKTSLLNIATDAAITQNTYDTSTIDERIALWNQIRNTNVFKQYLSSSVGSDYIAKATEFRNTYQTNTKPSETGTVNDTTAGDMSYAYTFDITPATYFLGPYKDTNKTQFNYVQYDGNASPTNGDGNTTARSIMDVTTLDEANYLYENGYTKAYQLFYYEYSDSSSNNQLCAVQRTSDYNSYYETYGNNWIYAFTWYKTSKTTDFTGGFLRGTYTDTRDNGQIVSSTWEDTPIYITVNGVQIDVNGGGISKFTSDSSGTTGEGGWYNNLNRTGKWTITDANQKQYTQTGTLTQWADFIIAHEVRHYISFPTEKLHPTLCTGLGKYRSGNRWFTFHPANPVYTSQYIDYSADDLLKLDGYLTSYNDGTTISEDERNIINDLFNNYFKNDGNFKNVVAAALLERNAYIDTDTYYPINNSNITFNQNFTSYYTFNHPTAYSANVKYYNLVDGNYELVDQNLVNNTNYSTYYIATRAITYDSSKSYYYKKDIDDINMSYINDFFINNIYTTNVVDNNHPFTYLYYSYSSTTVNNYLIGLNTSDFKDKFLAYCAANQSAYAKALLKLMVLNGENLSEIHYPISILNDDNINNIYSHQNLKIVNESNEIDDETYEYGYTFDNITISLDNSYNLLELYVAPISSSAQLNYSIDGGAYNSETITEGSIISIDLENNNYITITSNQDVILYCVYYSNYHYNSYENGSYYELDDSTKTYSASYPGYVIYKLPTALEMENYIYNHMSSRGLSDYSLSGYNVSFNVVSLRNSTGGDSWLRYHRIVIDDDGNTRTTNDITVIGTSSSRIQNNYTWSCPNSISDQYLGKYVGLMVATNNTQNSSQATFVYPNPDNGITMRQGGTIYRYNLYQIRVNFSYTCEKGGYNDYITTSDILNISLNYSGFSEYDKLISSLKNSQDYSTKYNTLLDDATHNLVPINYSEAGYRNTLVSNTYYKNDGDIYTNTTGVYDNTKKYYTLNNGEYTLANINDSTYYNTVESGKYYVSYQLSNSPYNSSNVYYTRSGNIYTKLNSLSEQEFYNTVNITNNAYYVITNNTDPDNPVYGLAGNTYDSSATYYTRSGDGTNENPYVYTQTNVTIAQFYEGGTSDTYYVNGGTNYQLAKYAFDNDLTYYTYDGNAYTAVSITSTQYYNSTTSNTYYSNFSIATAGYDSTSNTYYTRYGSGTTDDPYVYTVASPSSSQYYSSCSSTYYYVKNGDNYVLATGDYNSSTDYYVTEGENKVLYGNASKNIKGILELNYEHTDGDTPEYCVPDLVKLLITSSNEAFLSFINTTIIGSGSEETILPIIIRSLVSNVGYIILNDAIKARNTSLTTISKELIAAAYLVTDYKYILNNKTSVSASYLRAYINNTMASSYQYINSDGTYDYEKFEAFCHEIGYDLSTSGYGIYALASNQGKLNGLFIPDNLDITEMDAPYASEQVDSTDILVLQYNSSDELADSNYWRGGATVSAGDTESVNYAFFKDMKQVEQSISTAVFELDINYNGSTYYGDIDLDKKTITYYVPSIVTGNYSVTKQEYAYKATSDLGNSISVTSTTDGAVQETFIVTAENTSVTATYSIIFKVITIEFNLKYSDDTTSKTYSAFDEDLTLTLTLTSVDGKELPEGLNLEHYISFIGTNTYTPFDLNPVVSLSVSSVDHIVDENGDATITIIVSPKLPADTYEITVNILGVSDSVTFIKNASSGHEITEMIFDGNTVTFTTTGGITSATSYIPFGRAFNYADLTDIDSSNFYLYKFTYSNNASVDISATKSVDTDGLMTYDVTILVTAESGGNNYTEYHHYLKEKQFFVENSTYASIFADGEIVTTTAPTSEAEKVKYLYGGTLTYNLTEDTYTATDSNTGTWSLGDDMYSHIQFRRGYEPQYRIKYVLSNFYTLGENVVYGATSQTLNNGATVNVTYAGLTVTVSENNNPGIYKFSYTYTNTGIWDGDVEYVRYYEFPELVIEKLLSTDALLHQLTFLEESIMLGNTATVIIPTNTLYPEETDTVVGYEASDKLYSEVFNASSRDILVQSNGITYDNDSDAESISDYFAIGTVSDADLSYYCPTFKVDDYAQIYQYTTYKKLTSYGSGIQTEKDRIVLSNHDTMLLYVPFMYDNSGAEEKVVFLVELDSNNNWKYVYTTEYDGKATGTQNSAANTRLYTYNTTVTTSTARNGSANFTANGINYTIAQYAGEELNNNSLYMDYVGTPLDGHFWYVSYVIFSEDWLGGGVANGNVRFYHISIIDATNNVQFNVTIYADTTFSLQDVYMTISENIYKKIGQTRSYNSTRQISAYGVDTQTTYNGSEEYINGYKIYTLRYNLQTLPQGYFYFYVDLPDGYVANAYTDKGNKLAGDEFENVEEGSFLPQTSIITTKIALTIVIDRGLGDESGAWAVSTTDIYTRQAFYFDSPLIKKDTSITFGSSGNFSSTYSYYSKTYDVTNSGASSANVKKFTFAVDKNATVSITAGSNASYKVSYGGETTGTKTGNYNFTVDEATMITITSVGTTNNLASIAISYE